MKSNACAIVCVALLVGCSAPTPRVVDVPRTPEAFKEVDSRWVSAVPEESQPRGEWWRIFRDPELDRFMQVAIEDNTTIQAAAARLAKARAVAGIVDAARSPQLGLNAGYGRQGGPLINAAGGSGTLYTLSAGLSYEVDLAGRLAKASDAAAHDSEAQAALLQSTRLLIQADVAQAYFAVRALDVERDLLRATSGTQQAMVALTERRQALGSVADIEVERLRAESATIEAESSALERRRAELEHALSVLAGQVASVFELRPVPVWTDNLPVVPAGIPSTMLARRTDVAAARRSMLAAQARLGVAQTAWFPSVSLTTAHGFAAPDLRDLLGASVRAWSIGALLALPLLDGGRREAAVMGASADWDEAASGYRERILLAFKDVEDQLAGLRTLADQARAQAAVVAAADRVRRLSASRYDSGLASQLELLEAQRNELRARRQALQVRAQQFQTTVGLVRALGGGWGDGTRKIATAEAIADGR